MPSRDYQIVFRGRIAPGTAPDTARDNLAKLFKAQPSQVAKLFDGRRQVLKKGLEREAADRYRAALRKAGLIVSVVSAETERSAQTNVSAPPAVDQTSQDPAASANKGAPPPGRASFAIDDPAAKTDGGKAVFKVDDPPLPAAEKPSPPQVPADAGTTVESTDAAEPTAAAEQSADPIVDGVDGQDADLAPVGVQLVAPEKLEPLTFDLAAIELADPDELVDDTPPPPPLEVDTSALSASDEFSALDEKPQQPAPEVDLSGLAVASGDAPVDGAELPPPAEIDTSSLSVSEGFEGLEPNNPAETPAIDTSHLELLPGPDRES